MIDLHNLHDFWVLSKVVLTYFLYQGVVITRSRTKCLDQMRYVSWVTLCCFSANCMFEFCMLVTYHCEFKPTLQLQFESALFDSDFVFLLLSNKFNYKLTEFISALTQQTRPGLFSRQIMTTGNHHWSLTTEGLLWVNSLLLTAISCHAGIIISQKHELRRRIAHPFVCSLQWRHFHILAVLAHKWKELMPCWLMPFCLFPNLFRVWIQDGANLVKMHSFGKIHLQRRLLYMKWWIHHATSQTFCLFALRKTPWRWKVSSSRRRWPCRPRLSPELVWCWHWLQHVFHLPNFQTFWRFPSPVYPTKIPLTAFLFLWRTIIYVDFSFPPLIFVSFFMFLKVCITKLMQASVIQCRAIFFSSKGKRSWSTGFTKHESNFFIWHKCESHGRMHRTCAKYFNFLFFLGKGMHEQDGTRGLF